MTAVIVHTVDNTVVHTLQARSIGELFKNIPPQYQVQGYVIRRQA